MNLYLIFIFVTSLLGIKIFIKNSNKDYLNKENTTCIKGIFILIVFYSHLCKYIPYQSTKDFLMYDLRQFLGQLMVTMFLFYSGYGIYESIKKKKNNYINNIPIKRILITLLNFDIAVLTFAVVNQLIGNGKTIEEILLALTGWGGIGNSNWYIFAILFLYLSTYISFKVVKNHINKNEIIYTAIIKIEEKKLEIKVLLDTGNMLKDPITGDTVIIIEKEKLYDILPLELLNNIDNFFEFDNKVIKNEYQTRLRIIPFTSVGKRNGMMVGIKADYVSIITDIDEIKKDNAIICVYEKKFSKTDKYSGLIGLDILEGSEKNEYIANIKK